MTLSNIGVRLSIGGQGYRQQAAVAIRHTVAACAQAAWPFEATADERILLVPEAASLELAASPACAADRAASRYCHG